MPQMKKQTDDPFSRSVQMSRVRSKDTKPELRVRKALWTTGLRYRLQGSHLPGRPDIFFPKGRVAIFVHGCFWHRHPGCPRTRTPKSRIAFWTAKFTDNMDRDVRARQELKDLGWKVLIIWECETLNENRLKELAREVKSLITNPDPET